MAGWIYDFRQELDSTIWQMPPMYHRVWQYLKYTVNHSPARIPNKDGTFTDIAPGQHATSYRYLAKGVGYYEGTKWKEPNPKTIKAILDWLVTQNMITIQGNTYGTVVTVVNWSLYQSEKVKGNGKETEKKHFVDTNNKELINDESMNNDKHILPDSDIEEIRSNYKGTKTKVDAYKKLPKLIKTHGKEVLIQSVLNYNKHVDKERNSGFKDLKYMNESTFWNGRYLDYLNVSTESKLPPNEKIIDGVRYISGVKVYE